MVKVVEFTSDSKKYKEIRKEILDYLSLNGPCSVKELYDHLKEGNFFVQEEQVQKILNSLLNHYKIKTYQKEAAKKHDDLLYKIADYHKGFIVVEGKDKYIIEDDIKYPIINSDNSNIRDGSYAYYEKVPNGVKIARIIYTKGKKESGVVIEKENKKYIKADKDNLIIDGVSNLEVGSKIIFDRCRLTRQNVYSGCNIKYIGDEKDPNINTYTKLAQYNFDYDFPEEVLKEAEALPDSVSEEETKGRVDLRNEEIFSIDGDDTKDLDDTIGLKKLSNGHYILKVNIADVTYYVKEGSALDREAAKRTTSIYTRIVTPMFPRKLSNGICSLNPDVDRLTNTCEIELDEDGNVLNHKFYHSVIHSNKQMTYANVDKVLAGNCPEDYKKYESTLLLMKELKDKLRSKRITAGSVIFDRPEYQIIYDEKGKPVNYVKAPHGESNELNEEFMLLANEMCAYDLDNKYQELYHKKAPGIFRVHPQPRLDKINSVIAIMKQNGLDVEFVTEASTENMNNLLNYIDTLPEKEIYSSLLLHAMPKAYYSTNNIGHFGLGFNYYSHFTSPIRRYPDVIAHRTIDLYNEELSDEKIKDYTNQLVESTNYCSNREVAACRVEREVNKLDTASSMENNVGQEYKAKIENISDDIDIIIENGIRGSIKFNDQRIDHHVFETTFIIYDKIFKIGDTIDVILTESNKYNGNIKFTPKILTLKS